MNKNLNVNNFCEEDYSQLCPTPRRQPCSDGNNNTLSSKKIYVTLFALNYIIRLTLTYFQDFPTNGNVQIE